MRLGLWAVILKLGVLGSASVPEGCVPTRGYSYDLRFGTHIVVPTSVVNWSREWSMGAWFKLYSTNTIHFGIVGSAHDSCWADDLGILQVTYRRINFEGQSNGRWHSLYSNTTIPLFQWHHALGTWSPADGGRARLYVDGVLADQKVTGPAGKPRTLPLYVGLLKETGTHNGLTGQMDDISAWQHELSPAEVSAVFKGAQARDFPDLLLHFNADGDNSTHAIDKSGRGNHGKLVYGSDANPVFSVPFSYKADCLSCSSAPSTCGPYSRLSVCGDGVVTGDEQCDGGPGCTQQCMCEPGTMPRDFGIVARAACCERLKDITREYGDADFPNVKLLPAWHRTDKLKSVLKSGRVAESPDEWDFGRGMYSSFEALRAYAKCDNGALLACWVSFYSAYPVVDGDVKKLTGKGNFANYDAHFVPLRVIDS
eukprot:m51a1_g11983 hypothetical protein (425) ;mRNA; r:865985-868890